MRFGEREENEIKITVKALGIGDTDGAFPFYTCGACSFSEESHDPKNPDRLFCQNNKCLVEETFRRWTPAQAHENMLEGYQIEDDSIECLHDCLLVSCYNPRNIN